MPTAALVGLGTGQVADRITYNVSQQAISLCRERSRVRAGEDGRYWDYVRRTVNGKEPMAQPSIPYP